MDMDEGCLSLLRYRYLVAPLPQSIGVVLLFVR